MAETAPSKATIYYFNATQDKSERDAMHAKVLQAKALLKMLPCARHILTSNVQTLYQVRKDIEKQSRGHATYPITYIDSNYIGVRNGLESQPHHFAK